MTDLPTPASARIASVGTLEGPAPKRPSAGSSSAGMVIWSVTVGSVLGRSSGSL